MLCKEKTRVGYPTSRYKNLGLAASTCNPNNGKGWRLEDPRAGWLANLVKSASFRLSEMLPQKEKKKQTNKLWWREIEERHPMLTFVFHMNLHRQLHTNTQKTT